MLAGNNDMQCAMAIARGMIKADKLKAERDKGAAMARLLAGIGMED